MRRPSGDGLATASGDALRGDSDGTAALTRDGDRAGWRQLMRATIVSEASARAGELTGAFSARSTAFRHGLRLAVLLTLGWAVAHLLDLPRGYWVPLSTALILKPEHEATVVGGGSRLVGTCFSAAVIGFLAAYVHLHWIGNAVLVTVMMAIAIYVLWPAPAKLDMGSTLSCALHCQRDALADLHRRLTGRGAGGRRRDARAAWTSATIAEDAVSQAGATGVQPVDLQRGRTVVLSLRRMRLATARLNRRLRHEDLPPVATVTRFGEWLDGSLDAFEDGAAVLASEDGAAVLAGVGPPRPEPARWIQSAGDSWPQPLQDYASEMADSVDSIATMLSWGASVEPSAGLLPTSAIPSDRTSVRFTRLD
jgi:hypothetical protein